MDNFRDGAPQSLSALWVAPFDDLTYPARTLPHAILSCGVNLNAVLYQASGPGLHPTALLLHPPESACGSLLRPRLCESGMI